MTSTGLHIIMAMNVSHDKAKKSIFVRFICVRIPIDNDEYAAHKNNLYTIRKVYICYSITMQYEIVNAMMLIC